MHYPCTIKSSWRYINILVVLEKNIPQLLSMYCIIQYSPRSYLYYALHSYPWLLPSSYLYHVLHYPLLLPTSYLYCVLHYPLFSLVLTSPLEALHAHDYSPVLICTNVLHYPLLLPTSYPYCVLHDPLLSLVLTGSFLCITLPMTILSSSYLYYVLHYPLLLPTSYLYCVLHDPLLSPQFLPSPCTTLSTTVSLLPFLTSLNKSSSAPAKMLPILLLSAARKFSLLISTCITVSSSLALSTLWLTVSGCWACGEMTRNICKKKIGTRKCARLAKFQWVIPSIN
jgi:hypothetical protein